MLSEHEVKPYLLTVYNHTRGEVNRESERSDFLGPSVITHWTFSTVLPLATGLSRLSVVSLIGHP